MVKRRTSVNSFGRLFSLDTLSFFTPNGNSNSHVGSDWQLGSSKSSISLYVQKSRDHDCHCLKKSSIMAFCRSTKSAKSYKNQLPSIKLNIELMSRKKPASIKTNRAKWMKQSIERPKFRFIAFILPKCFFYFETNWCPNASLAPLLVQFDENHGASIKD